jgi:hypothetical protein
MERKGLDRVLGVGFVSGLDEFGPKQRVVRAPQVNLPRDGFEEVNLLIGTQEPLFKERKELLKLLGLNQRDEALLTTM